jgi:N-acetylmuramoyl-L-alanine amidase
MTIDVDSLVFLKPNFLPQWIVIHHSLTKDSKTVSWDAIRKYHMEVNHWSDVGYHFGTELVGSNYVIQEGRSMLRMGAHVQNFNHHSIGICMVGNFDLEPVPVEQWRLTLRLVKKLQHFLSIPTKQVIGHREAQVLVNVPPSGRKSCPGNKCDMNSFRRDLVEDTI